MLTYYVVFSTGHLFRLEVSTKIADEEIERFIFNYAYKNIDVHLTHDYSLVDDRFYVYTDTGEKIQAILYNHINSYTIK